MLMELDREEVIRQHQGSAPVNLIALAKDLNIDVFSANDWDAGISGFIRRKPGDPSRFEIYVNASHSYVRRRFTIAHEIAHAILHGDRIGDGITEDALLRSGLPDSIEWEANRMAADILMPRHLLKPMLDRGETDISELANRFKVSREAMAIRLGVPQ